MPLDMNPEIRAQWTAALRSGRYPQGTNALRLGSAFCCLGVLCDLAEQDGITEGREDDEGTFSYDGMPDLLPESVQEWAGLASGGDPSVLFPNWTDGEPAVVELTELNDDYSWDFARIADAIDGGVKP